MAAAIVGVNAGARTAMQEPGQRVLVVEDDPSIARLLEIELGEAGYRVKLARTGAEGLAAIETGEPASSCSTSGCRTSMGAPCVAVPAAAVIRCRS